MRVGIISKPLVSFILFLFCSTWQVLLAACSWSLSLEGGVTRGLVFLKPNNTAARGTICSDGYKQEGNGNLTDVDVNPNALATCHSLGFPSDVAEYTNTFGVGAPSDPIWLSEVKCSAGRDYYLENCSYTNGPSQCQHGDDVGLKCSVPSSKWKFSLKWGTRACGGLVVMEPVAGMPIGVVYSPPFNNPAQALSLRKAMCSSLNCPLERPSVATLLTNPSEVADLPRYFNPSECPSSATGIGQCSMEGGSRFLEDRTAWQNSDSLAINCNYVLTDGMEVYLQDGPQLWAGNIMVKFTDSTHTKAGVIGATCFRALSSRWDTLDDASMRTDTLNAVCRQLGYVTSTARMRFYRRRSETVVLDWNDCSQAQRLSECNISIFDNIPRGCDESTTAGVDCFPERTLQDVEVALVGGFSNYSGQIQYRYNATSPWQSLSISSLSSSGVVTDASTTNIAALNAICNTWLGITTVSNARLRFFGPTAKAPIWGDAVRCPAGATGLRMCDIIAVPNPVYSTQLYAGVDCLPDYSSSLSREYTLENNEIKMRLVGADFSTPWSGVCVPEVNAFAVWDAFCATVGRGGKSSLRLQRSNGTQPFLLSSIICPASAASGGVSLCSSAPIGSHTCEAKDALFLSCDSAPISPQQWRVDVINTTTKSKGLVTFQPTASHPQGVFCATTDLSALISICRSLGYANSTSPRSYTSGDLASEAASAGLVGHYMYEPACSPYHNVSSCTYAHFEAEVCQPMRIDCFPPSDTPRAWHLRLSRGSEGRLEVKPSDGAEWGTVCGLGWTKSATAAACRSLGFNSSSARQRSIDFYGYGSGPIWLSSVSCKSNDLLQNCSYYFNVEGTAESIYCGHGNDVALECDPSPVNPSEWMFRFRQYDILWPDRLRVEMTPSASSSAEWGSISQCTPSDAVVAAACRMAGYTLGVYASLPSVPGPGRVYASEFSCPDGAQDLRLCPSDINSFGNLLSHSCDLTVDCNPLTSDPSKWVFELRDGGTSISGSGRLHVRPAASAAWGTVCGRGFSVASSLAACVSAGYSVPYPRAAQLYFYPEVQTYGRVWLADMVCSNRPLTHLQNCTDYTFMADDCPHSADVWLSCYPNIRARFVDGPSNSRGRLEVRNAQVPNGEWGTVCNDNFALHYEAWQAACRSAGFFNVTFPLYENWGPGTGLINLDDVTCVSGPSENTTLEDCDYAPFGTSNCNHEEDAGVDCFPPLPLSGWSFRLDGGSGSSTAGRIEIRPAVGLPWGGICSLPSFNHTYSSWISACRSAGITTMRAVPKAFGPPSSGYMMLEGVHCATVQPSLATCAHSDVSIYNCSQQYASGVDCNPPVTAEDTRRWSVRLTSGTKGRVEIMFNTYGANSEPWGTVCSDGGGTSLNALRAVCGAAGHTATSPALMTPSTDGYVVAEEWQPIYLSNLACSAGSTDLTMCTFAPMYSHSCSHTQDLFVDCFPPTTTPPPTTTTTTATTRTTATTSTASPTSASQSSTTTSTSAPTTTRPTTSATATSTTTTTATTATPTTTTTTAQPTSSTTRASTTTTTPTTTTTTRATTTVPTTTTVTEPPLPACSGINVVLEADAVFTDASIQTRGLRVLILSHTGSVPSSGSGGGGVVPQYWKNMSELSAYKPELNTQSNDVSGFFDFIDIYTGTREPEAFWRNFVDPSRETQKVGTGGAQSPAKVKCELINATLIICTIPPTPSYKLSAAEGIEGRFVLPLGQLLSPPCLSNSVPVILSVHVEAEQRDAFGAAVDAIGTISNGVGAVVGALIGASVMEIQYVSVQMQSLCMSELDRRSSDAMQYFISPFVYLGFAAVAFGNIAIAVLAGLLQYALSVKFMTSRGISKQDAWAAVRFPSLAYGISQVFYIGVCYGTFKLLSEEDDGLSIFAGVVSFMLLIGYIILLLHFVRATMRARFVQYTQFLSKPSSTRWLYPLGFWDPDNLRLSYGHMINPFRDECIRYNLHQFCVGFLVSLIIVISQIDCFVRFVLVAFIFAGSACAHLYGRPSRLPPVNFLCAIAQIVMAVWCILSAVAIKTPSKEVERAKLLLALCQVVVIFVRAVYQFTIAVFEESRWRHFMRPDMHGYVDDASLQAEGKKKAFMEGVNMEDLLLLGMGGKPRIAVGAAAKSPRAGSRGAHSKTKNNSSAKTAGRSDAETPLLEDMDEESSSPVELMQMERSRDVAPEKDDELGMTNDHEEVELEEVELPPTFISSPPALTPAEEVMRMGMKGMLDAFPEAARCRHIEILIVLWGIEIDKDVRDPTQREAIVLACISKEVNGRYKVDQSLSSAATAQPPEERLKSEATLEDLDLLSGGKKGDDELSIDEEEAPEQHHPNPKDAAGDDEDLSVEGFFSEL